MEGIGEGTLSFPFFEVRKTSKSPFRAKYLNSFFRRLLTVVADNVEVVIDTLNKALASINLWCRNNKLTIYTRKSEAMIFTHKPFCGPLKLVMLRNKVLDYVTGAKCLGIIIDNQLSWLSHIELICRSFGQKVSAKKAQVFKKGYVTVY